MSKNTIENKKKNSNSIKIGLISQDSSIINVFQLFESYFDKSKPNPCIIKDENHFEFSLLSIPQLLITINHFKDIQEIHDKYNSFNFLLIFIDIENNNSITLFLEKTIDILTEIEDNFNKKCYIYGFFQDDEKEKLTEEKITNLLESKGIEYYYNEIKNNDISSFSKLIEYTISDCNTIMIEKYLAQKHSELVDDNSNSHCKIY